ncbi:hypothetical protein M9H77_31219 [Catharanthus roseus]|uniref:Uncharacterized protein n=1 Tax=Catharanthus roseus TaxID=4058 RepID=A0ACC0A240_CATRO|nr:hypothetical protein M9H77_31219 [Catharanthus roseus]
MGLEGIQEETGGGTAEPTAGAWCIRTVGTVCPTASAKETVSRYMIRPILGEELKANAEHLHIKTGSPILTDEQLMFQHTGGSNKSQVYGFGSQSAVVIPKRRGGSSNSMSSVASVSCTAGHEACIERGRRLWGYM